MREILLERLDLSVANGSDLLGRAEDMFPRLRFGDLAFVQIEALSGNETVFRQLIWHLRVLNQSALDWREGPFEPRGISYSVESAATLDHGRYGPMRDFPAPVGFTNGRWSLHTKLTGGNGARMYYRFEVLEGAAIVAIGYFGEHLPTVRYP